MYCFRFTLPILVFSATIPLASALGAGERPTVAHPASLIKNGDFTENLSEGDFSQGSWATIRTAVMAATLDPPVAGYRRMARLDSSPTPGGMPWNTCFVQRCTGAASKGDAIYFRAWLRSPDRCPVCFVYESRRDAHKFIEQVVGLTPDWKEYRFVGRVDRELASGESQVNFFLGYKRGLVEMTGVRVENYGPATGHAFDPTAVSPPPPEDLIVREAPPERPPLSPPVSLIRNGDFSESLSAYPKTTAAALRGQKISGRQTVLGSALKDNWDTGDAALVKVAPVAAQAGPYSRALRLECNPRPGDDPSKIALRQPCAGEVRRGDAVYFRAWLRSPDGCSACFVWKMNPWPHRAMIEQLVWLTPEWREYRFLARADRDFASGETTANLLAGYKKGTLEVAGVRMENFGGTPSKAFDETVDHYGGRPHPDTSRAAALARIEQIRKGDLSIRVVDAAGRPVDGARAGRAATPPLPLRQRGGGRPAGRYEGPRQSALSARGAAAV